MTDEVPKRRGRPPKIAALGPEPLPDLEAAVFTAVKQAFPKAAITITDLPAGHPKLANRGLLPQIHIRAAIPKFAVAAMIPKNGTADDLSAVLESMRADWDEFDRRSRQEYAKSGG